MTVTLNGRILALIGLLALVAALIPATPASAQLTADNTAYVVGDSPEEASIKNSRLTYTPLMGDVDVPATEVLLGTADTFADNLAAGTLMGQAIDGGRPLYLVDGDTVSDEILAEIARVTNNADAADVTVHLLGGENALSADVESQMSDAGYATNRFEGETRIETAAAIAGATTNDTVFVVRGFANEDPTQAYADSVTVGGVAATIGADILFTQTDVLTGNTESALSEGGYDTAYVVGGVSAINDDVLAAVTDIVPGTARIAGDTRFETSIAVNNLRPSPVGPFALLTDGQDAASWTDATPAANWSGLTNAPILLTNQGMIPQETEDYILANHENADAAFAAHGTQFFAFCLTLVSPETCGEIAALQGGVTSEFDADAPPAPVGNDTITVTPIEEATLAVVPDADEPDSADDRVYTISDLDDATAYRITLVIEDNITINEDGNFTFIDEDDNGAADAGMNPGALITVVNNTTVAAPARTLPVGTDDPANPTGIFPVNGTITFTIDGEDPVGEPVVPVVYPNAGETTFLEIDEDGLPIEAFGVGGLTTYVNPEADPGTIGDDILITGVDKDSGLIQAGGLSYYYDDNDLYYIDGNDNDAIDAGEQVTMAAFIASLTEGDELDGEVYATDPSLPSQFLINDISPASPAAVLNDAAEDSVTLDVTEADILDDATVNVYFVEDDADADPAFADTFAVQSFDTDGDADTAEFQVTVTGLDADTEYDFFVTQTVGDEESAIPTEVRDVLTDQTPDDIMIETANVNETNDGTTGATSNQIVVTFDTDIDPDYTGAADGCDETNISVYPTNQPNVDLAVATCTATGADTITVVMAAPINDAASDVSYTIELANPTVEVEDGTPNDGPFNGDLTATFSY